MDCDNLSYDNRETCVNPVPSSCVPYTGYISTTIADDVPDCKPNINDVINKLKTQAGDLTTLDKSCLTFTPATVTQKELDQLFIDELCTIKAQIAALDLTVDPGTIEIAINLLCLEDPACDPQLTYTLQEILVKLITAYCNLLTRVTNIETILNI
jgi:hypothetical protein